MSELQELQELQNKFQEHLLNSNQEIFHDIVVTENVSTDVRLKIYSHAYRSRLVEALSTNYPVLHACLGDEQFETLAFAYMDLYPSFYRSIRWFGDRLENFLQENSPYDDFPHLIELARVEWIMTLVFDAADSEIFTLEKLGQIPPECWEEMRVIFQPSIYQTQLSWNVMPIWQAITQDEAPEELVQNEFSTAWIFWRNNLMSYYCSVSDDEAAAIAAARSGHSFSEICAVLCEWVDEQHVATRAVSLMKGWVSAGLIAEIH